MKPKLILLFSGLVMLAGCGSSSSDYAGFISQGNVQPNAAAAVVEFETVAEGSDSGFIVATHAVEKPTLMVLDSQEVLDEFWQKHVYIFSPEPAAPPVDFAVEMLLVVVDKVEPSTGYYFEVQGVYESNDLITLSVKKYVPGLDCIVGDALAVPYFIVRTAASSKEVRLELSEVIQACGQ